VAGSKFTDIPVVGENEMLRELHEPTSTVQSFFSLGLWSLLTLPVFWLSHTLTCKN
jgi:hypothetical protein